MRPSEDPGRPGGPHPSLSDLAAERATPSQAIEVPEVSLPRGGGALRGIDEKFEVNPANGTASLRIPLPVSPGRQDFTPSLGLTYNSGGGNGPFGLGWSLDLPRIQRATDKFIPRYDGQDLFLLTGGEELVPYLQEDGGNWVPEEKTVGGRLIRRYRPRIEGDFSLIERVEGPGEAPFWKVTTRDNVSTWFGCSAGARLADPEDPSRIYAWFPELSCDHRGNCIHYRYKADGNATPAEREALPRTLADRNRRNGLARFAQTYLKDVRYGNPSPFYPDDPYRPTLPGPGEAFYFQLLLDYGEHAADAPGPADSAAWAYRPDPFSAYRSGFEVRTLRRCQRVLLFHHFPGELQWPGEPDEAPFGSNYLVRSLDLDYQASSIDGSGDHEVSYLVGITERGYIRKDGAYHAESLPAMAFQYQALRWDTEVREVEEESLVHAPAGQDARYQWVDLFGEGIRGLLTEQGTGWWYKPNLGPRVDLAEEGGLPGAAGEGGAGSNGSSAPAPVALGPAIPVAPKPSFLGLDSGQLSLQDLEANGRKQLVVQAGPLRGYFELEADEAWAPFQPLEQRVQWRLDDPNTRLLDITGNGQPDIVVTEEEAFLYFPAAGKSGHQAAARCVKALDEERGPAIVFADGEQSIFLADMTGDGLTDIVRIRNGQVCYWANRGYGRFSAKVAMDNAPRLDRPDHFDPSALHLADISGTGTTDLVYVGPESCRAFLNLGGNAWSAGHDLTDALPRHRLAQVAVLDLLGQGTACLVWSDGLPGASGAAMRYLDLMGGRKPHLLVGLENNLGKTTRLTYRSSTHFYLADQAAGRPWKSRLAFPVSVVSQVVTEDRLSEARFTTTYTYHHGYYDAAEREFRGFGRVEQTDSESYLAWSANNPQNRLEDLPETFQPPMRIVRWYHTGFFLDRERLLDQFRDEYWPAAFRRAFPAASAGSAEPQLDDARVVAGSALADPGLVDRLSGAEWREALRACKGLLLREEVFALDAPLEVPTDPGALAAYQQQVQRQAIPYTVKTQRALVQVLQPRGAENPFAVFLKTAAESLTLHYERQPDDPRIAHTLHLRTDELGQVLEQVDIVYPRAAARAQAAFDAWRSRPNTLPSAQEQAAFTANLQYAQDRQQDTLITYVHRSWTNDLYPVDGTAYRLRQAAGEARYQLTGFAPAGDLYEAADFAGVDALPITPFEQAPGAGPQRRLLERAEQTYYREDLADELPLGQQATHGLPFQSYQLAFTPTLLTHLYGARLPADPAALADLLGDTADGAVQRQGKYVQRGGDWWVRSGIKSYRSGGDDLATVRQRFYSPIAYTDPFGSTTRVGYHLNHLLLNELTDELDNRRRVEAFDLRTLAPVLLRDANDNLSQIRLDELGRVKAFAHLGQDLDQDGIAETDLADSLQGVAILSADDLATRQTFWNAADSASLMPAARTLLGQATRRFVYDPERYPSSRQARDAQLAAQPGLDPCQWLPLQPNASAAIARERHHAETASPPLQCTFVYTDGLGQELMTKAQAEPGEALQATLGADCSYAVSSVDTSPNLRWIGSGRSVRNNKGKVVRRYEPYFSTTPHYEDARQLVERGVSQTHTFDAAGRLVQTRYPDGTLARKQYGAWAEMHYDPNDTLRAGTWYAPRRNRLIDAELLAAGKDPEREAEAALQSEPHDDTPGVNHLDTLGRPILALEQNASGGTASIASSRIELDIEGNVGRIVDSRGNAAMIYRYNLLGQRLYEHSADRGERWMLNTAGGQPLRRWDSRNHTLAYAYDPLQRPLETRVQGGDGDSPLDHLVERIDYGEGSPNDRQRNRRGRAVRRFDTAGLTETDSYDRLGNPLSQQQRLLADPRAVPDYAVADPTTLLLAEVFTSADAFDALGRPTQSTRADGSVVTTAYNPAGRLETLHLQQGGQTETLITSVAYNARGQRTRVQYGNGTQTTYTYDRETFRLLRMRSTSGGGAASGGPTGLLQDLRYTYDPSGNVTHVHDAAVPDVFFNNFRVEPAARYTYDAAYRLVAATGREHTALLNHDAADNWADLPMQVQHSVNDAMAMRHYAQSYAYDSVGNILSMQHVAPGGNWTRSYAYPANNNRLSQTTVGGQTYAYPHHAQHGFLTDLPHLSLLRYNFRDELQATARQVLADGTPPTTWYQYDSSGKRVRKVRYRAGGASVEEERLYLPGLEIHRRYAAGGALEVERQVLHLMHGQRRVALIDRRTAGSDSAAARLLRYQLGNHLDSAQLELDGNGDVISYEEYHPFGTTAYQARNAAILARAKRYRYQGMERDEESGFSYHGARYYLPWLGRWLSPDPAGLRDGPNLYRFARNNPVRLVDRTGTNGDDPDPDADDEPAVTLSPHLTQFTPSYYGTSLLTGETTVAGHLRSGFTLGVSSLSLSTPGFVDADVVASANPTTGTTRLDAEGGFVLGTPGSGLNFVGTGSGFLQGPASGLPLGGDAAAYARYFALSQGRFELDSSLVAGGFQLATLTAEGSVDRGRFELSAQAEGVAGVAEVEVTASGVTTTEGDISAQVQLRAEAGYGLVGLEASGSGTTTEPGRFEFGATGRLRLFGIPSLRLQGSGSVDAEEARFEGTAYGYVPPASYVTGSYSLSSTEGIAAQAHVFGLTYTPEIEIRDPSPLPPAARAALGGVPDPSQPSGPTLGYSFTQYQGGGLTHISGGMMPLASDPLTFGLFLRRDF